MVRGWDIAVPCHTWLGSSAFGVGDLQAFLFPSRSCGLPSRPHSWLEQLGLCSSHAGSSVDTGFFFFGAGGFENAAVNF